MFRVLWFLGPIPCWSLKLIVSPGGPDESPILVVGGNIHIDFTPEPGDPEEINVWLYDVVRNNHTEIKGNVEPVENIRFIFPIPIVPPGRIYFVRAATLNHEPLIDSSTFEIFANASDATKTSTSTSHSPSTTSTPSLISTTTKLIQESSDPSNASGAGDGTTNASKKPLVGAITGGISGGLIFIVIIFVLALYFRRRRQRGHTLLAEHRRKEISPFTATGPLVVGAGSDSDLEITMGSTSPASPEAITYLNPYPNSKSNRSRPAQQMVSIYIPKSESHGREHHDAISSHQDEEVVSVVRDETDVRRELEALREQVRRLREDSSWVQGNVSNEPPPDYSAARNGRS